MSRTRLTAPLNLTADRAQALALVPVSRETAARLDRFVAVLLTWQDTTQLIASSTVAHLWTRHIADSLQLIDAAPKARTWVDLGSGGGFPGLVLACALVDTPDAVVHLVESNMKKAAFLREAVRATNVHAVVHAERIEIFTQGFADQADVVTARALAPLKRLLEQSFGLLTTGALGVFPKGQDVEAELTEASKYWTIDAELIQSKTDPRGRIVLVRDAKKR